MTREAFAWAPLIALGCGLIAGLGGLHSARRIFGLGLALMAGQVIAWMVVLMLAARLGEGHTDWNPDLWASYLLSLCVVIPDTVIGGVLSGVVVGLLQGKARPGRGAPSRSRWSQRSGRGRRW
jgi:hypothetical protein